jgi:hypothetical protein
VDLAAVHFAWAGSTDHAHSVWRDPERDFGLDALARHRAAHHPG